MFWPGRATGRWSEFRKGLVQNFRNPKLIWGCRSDSSVMSVGRSHTSATAISFPTWLARSGERCQGANSFSALLVNGHRHQMTSAR